VCYKDVKRAFDLISTIILLLALIIPILVIKSDLPKEIDKQMIHDRYKDLAEVERAFRTCETGLLEMRPWYVQLEKVLVVMPWW